MKISLFGATGRTGRRILAQALARGDSVTCLVRETKRNAAVGAGLTLIQGDVLDAGSAAQAITGGDAVIVALKIPVENRIAAIDNIIAGMKRHGVRRIIAIGGSGCLQVDEQTRYHETATFPEIFRAGSIAHWEVCKRLMANDLDWTFVCPPDIPDGERTGKYIAQATYRPKGNSIFTGDLADFMLNELSKNEFVKMRVGVANML